MFACDSAPWGDGGGATPGHVIIRKLQGLGDQARVPPRTTFVHPRIWHCAHKQDSRDINDKQSSLWCHNDAY